MGYLITHTAAGQEAKSGYPDDSNTTLHRGAEALADKAIIDYQEYSTWGEV